MVMVGQELSHQAHRGLMGRTEQQGERSAALRVPTHPPWGGVPLRMALLLAAHLEPGEAPPTPSPCSWEGLCMCLKVLSSCASTLLRLLGVWLAYFLLHKRQQRQEAQNLRCLHCTHQNSGGRPPFSR